MMSRMLFLVTAFFLFVVSNDAGAQGLRKIRISNATLSYSALLLVAAREWKLFHDHGLEVEVILMRSAAAGASPSNWRRSWVTRCREGAMECWSSGVMDYCFSEHPLLHYFITPVCAISQFPTGTNNSLSAGRLGM